MLEKDDSKMPASEIVKLGRRLGLSIMKLAFQEYYTPMQSPLHWKTVPSNL